jgi:hypothetical protein
MVTPIEKTLTVSQVQPRSQMILRILVLFRSTLHIKKQRGFPLLKQNQTISWVYWDLTLRDEGFLSGGSRLTLKIFKDTKRDLKIIYENQKSVFMIF